MNRILTSVLLIIFWSASVYGQCNVDIVASTLTVPCGGGSVTLTASANGGTTAVLNENFNAGSVGTGWAVSPAGQFNNPCDPSYDGATYMWMGNTTAAPRTLTTNSFDLTCGGEVCFYLDFSTQGGASPCEGPDLPNEGVNFEYSTNGGATWTLINYFQPNPAGGAGAITSWAQYCFPIPAGAQTANTLFHWFQNGSSGTCCDHWGIDDVTINAIDCGSFWYDWSHIPGTVGPAGDNAVQTVNVVTDTTFTVTYTNGLGVSCTNQITIDVLGVDADFSASTVCEGTATQFTDLSTGSGDAITAWDWDFTSNGSVDNNTQNPSNGYVSGNYNVTLTATSAGGCSSSITKPVVINPVPTANFSQIDVCDGDLMSFTNTSSIGSGSITAYSWDFGDAVGTSTAQNPTYTFGASGTYNVMLTVTSDGGCIDNETVAVNVYDNPTANFGLADVCDGDAYIFEDNSIGNGAVIDTWSWDFTNDGTADNANQNTSNLYPSDGTYDVALTVTTQEGCTGSVVQTITVLALPVAIFNVSQECQGVATQFTDASTTSAGTITNWAWDFTNNGSVDNVTQNPTNVMGPTGNYTTSLTVTTSNGCSSSTTNAVTVDPLPVASYTWTDVCEGLVMNFTDASTVSSGAITGYQWDFGDLVGSSTTQNSTYTYGSPGTYNAVLTVTTDQGCIGSTTNVVEVYNNPTAAFNFADVCYGAAVSFTSTSTGNGGVIISSQWDFTNNGSNDYNGTNTDYTYGADGSYDVNLTITTADGCTDNLVQTVTVFPSPIAAFTGQNVCEGFDVTFTDLSTVSNGTITNYAWDFGMGATSVLQSPTQNFPNEGVYNVMLTVTSNNGCTNISTAPVEIYPTPVPQFITTDVCDGSVASFTDFSTVSNASTNNNIVDWQWDFGTTPAVTSTGQFASYTYPTVGTYTVSLNVTSNNGCVNSATNDVTIYPNPVVDFSSPNPDGCTVWCPDFVNNSSIASGTINAYLWNLGDGTASTDATPVHCYTNSLLVTQTYTVSVTMTSDFGCSSSATEFDMITVYPTPVAEFANDPLEGTVYQPTINFINQSLISDVFEWDFAGLGSSALESPSFTFPDQDSGVYEVCLHVETVHGCVNDICHDVVIQGFSNLYVPNSFTPDGDGVNDFFMPSFYGFSEDDYSFMVFDRWGLLIYQSDNLSGSWNGTYKGAACQQDAYVWKLQAKDKYTGEQVEKIGHVMLLR